MIYINAYSKASKSANILRHMLGAKWHNESSGTGICINWGDSSANLEGHPVILNIPSAVALATNKHKFFDKLKGKPYIPQYTTNKNEALEWIKKNKKVVERHKLQGHSGEGIKIATTEEELSDAKLYVRYVPKKEEYRVHVFEGEIIDVQQKRKKLDTEGVSNYNPFIRSHLHGWVFCRENVNPKSSVFDAAIDAVAALGLSFGGVDVIYNEHSDKPYVLEVNTAPGIEGETVHIYTSTFLNYIETL